jgi:hypothetical protein
MRVVPRAGGVDDFLDLLERQDERLAWPIRLNPS